MTKRGFTIIELLVVISILGLIASVALANLQTARDKAKVAAGQQFNSSLESSLGVETVGKWEFNEGAGSSVADGSGNNLVGTITGATYQPNGISDYALYFTDGNDYVTGGYYPNPGHNGRLTVVAWVKPTDVAPTNTIIGVHGASCTAFQVSIVGGKIYSGSSATEVLAGANRLAPKNLAAVDPPPTVIDEVAVPDVRVITNNNWQNIAVVYDNGTIKSYVNGALAGTVTNAGTADCPNAVWSIGGSAIQAPLGHGFRGSIDSVRIYNSTLTAAGINQLFVDGKKSLDLLVNR